MTESERDDLDWDVDQHGRMAEYATGPEDEPETVPFEMFDPDVMLGDY